MRVRRGVIQLGLAAILLTLSYQARAQQQTKIPRVGYVSGTGDAFNQEPYVEALKQGLKELGCTEGENITIDIAARKQSRIVSSIL